MNCFAQTGNSRAAGGEGFDVVTDDDDREFQRLVQIANQGADFALPGRIDPGHGLIENDDLWARHQSAGDEETLLLTAGKLADGHVGEMGDAHLPHDLLGVFEVGGDVAAEQAGLSDQSEADDLAGGEGKAPLGTGALRNIPDDVAAPACLQRREAGDGDGSAVAVEQAEHDAQERCLSCAVGSDDAQVHSRFDIEAHIFENLRLFVRGRAADAKAEADVLDANDIVFGALRGRGAAMVVMRMIAGNCRGRFIHG